MLKILCPAFKRTYHWRRIVQWIWRSPNDNCYTVKSFRSKLIIWKSVCWAGGLFIVAYYHHDKLNRMTCCKIKSQNWRLIIITNENNKTVIKVKLKLLSWFHFITLFIYLDYFFWSPVLLYHKIISMKVQEYSSLFLFFFLFFFIKQ